MMKLIQLEWMKLRNLNTLKIILLIYGIVLPGIYLLYSQLQFGPFNVTSEVYQFPEVYGMMAWTSSWFNLIIGVIIIVFTTNEIKYKTQRQNLIDGLKKSDIILAKFLVVVGLAAAVSLYVFLLAFVFGLINGGTGMFDGIDQIGVYFIMTLGYFAFAFFFANLVKLPALAIILYLLSTVIEGILGFLTIQDYVQFLPLSTFKGLVPFPTIIFQKSIGIEMDSEIANATFLTQGMRTLLAFGYMSVFLIVSYAVIKRRDI